MTTRTRDHKATWQARKARLALAAELALLDSPTLPGMTIAPTGVTVTGPVDEQATIQALMQLRRAEAAWNWITADLANALAADPAIGPARTNQLLAPLDMSQAHLARCRAVALLVPVERRRPELTWSHHEEVARLDPDEQAEWLDAAVTRGLSVKALREAIDLATADQERLPLEDPPVLPRPPASRLRELLAQAQVAVVWEPESGTMLDTCGLTAPEVHAACEAWIRSRAS